MNRPSFGRISPFVRDVALTTGTAAATTMSAIVVVRLLAHALGPDEFGSYTLARRFVATAAPVTTLMIGDSLARHAATVKPDQRSAVLVAGLIVGLLPTCLVAVIALAAPGFVSAVVFGSAGSTSLLRASLLMLVGYAVYSVLYAGYRGFGRMTSANLSELMVVAVGPMVLALLFAHRGSAVLIVVLFGLPFYVSLLLLLALTAKLGREGGVTVASLIGALQGLVRYGAPRIPGGFALPFLLTMAPLLSTHFVERASAGYLVAAQSLLRVVEGAVVAVGLVALPKVTRLFTDGHHDFLGLRITDMVAFALHMGVFAATFLALWADTIVFAWLGRDYGATVPLMRIMMVALCPYLVYVILRAVIDAIEEQAINTLHLLIALVVSAITSGLALVGDLGANGLAAGTSVGYVTLGILTVRYLGRRYTIDWKVVSTIPVLALNAALGFLVWPIARLVQRASLSDVNSLIAFFVTGFVVFVIYYSALRRLNIRWVRELHRRL